MRSLTIICAIPLFPAILLASVHCGPGDHCSVTATCKQEGGGGGGGATGGTGPGPGGGPQGGGGSGATGGAVGGGAGGGGGGGAAPSPGDVIWEASFGDAANDDIAAAAFQSDGSLVLAGGFEGSLDFGGGALVSGGGQDVFVAALDAAGNQVWAKQYGGVGDQIATGMDVDAMGNAFVVGHFGGSIDFGSGVHNAVDAEDLFAAKLSANGDGLWSTAVDGQNEAGGPAAVGPNNNLIFMGEFDTTITLGSQTLTSAQQASNTFLTSWSGANGQPTWSDGAYSNGYGNFVRPGTLDADTAGNVAFHVRASQQMASLLSVTYDGVSESEPAHPQGYPNSFGVLFRTDSLGGYAWHKRLDPLVDVSMYPNGDVLVCGGYNGSGTFADGFNLPTSQGWDVFAARYSSTGTLLWSRRYGGPGADGGNASARGVACAALADNTHLIVARAEGAFDIGATTVLGNAPGLVIGTIDDSGEVVWTQRASGNATRIAVATADSLATIVLGFDATMGIESTFSSAGASDIYAVALAL